MFNLIKELHRSNRTEEKKVTQRVHMVPYPLILVTNLDKKREEEVTNLLSEFKYALSLNPNNAL